MESSTSLPNFIILPTQKKRIACFFFPLIGKEFFGKEVGVYGCFLLAPEKHCNESYDSAPIQLNKGNADPALKEVRQQIRSSLAGSQLRCRTVLFLRLSIHKIILREPRPKQTELGSGKKVTSRARNVRPAKTKTSTTEVSLPATFG